MWTTQRHLPAHKAAGTTRWSIDRPPGCEGAVEGDDMDESLRIDRECRQRRTCVGYIRGHGAEDGAEEGEVFHLGKG